MNLASIMSQSQSMNCLVGECLDDNHPDFAELYRIGLPGVDAEGESWWLAAIDGVEVQQGDLVVLLAPKNWDEPIISGVLASNGSRMPSEYQPPAPQKTVVLRSSDDMIRVTTSDGRPLVEVGRNLHGPVIRISGRDAQLDIPGHLRIAAGRLDLESRNDDIHIKSDKEVVVSGDMIRLN